MSNSSSVESFARGTVPWLVRAVVDWAEAVGQGLALVVWRSARERDLAVAALHERFREKGLTADEVRGLRLTVQEFVPSIAHSAADVLLVLDPDAVIFGGEERAPWWLNSYRESLVSFPGAQIWFMPEQAAIRFGRDLPDLARFFLFRETLTGGDAIEGEREMQLPAVQETGAVESARGEVLLQRALEAASKGGSPARIWVELGLPATAAFLEARDLTGATRVMTRLSESLGPPEAALKDAEGLAPQWVASGHNVLSRWYAEQGALEAALAAQEQSVRIYRLLADASREDFLPDLAVSLNNLSNRQNDLGRHEDALASIEESVRIVRQLAEAHPEAFVLDLAHSINNLMYRQDALGRRKDALASIEEAVRTRRQLAAGQPETFLPDLAHSLNNLSKRQSALGRREDALASIEEAVRIFRQLAEARPEAFLPDLAESLHNQSLWQSALGRREDALASIEEAVRIFRQLAEARPEAFPHVALSLQVQGGYLAASGRLPEALAASTESLRSLAPFAQRDPDWFRDFATATLRDYLRRSEAMGVDVDSELLRAYAHCTGENRLINANQSSVVENRDR